MRCKISEYKKSIYEIGLSREREVMIWDFYVTKSIANSSGQKRDAKSYGWDKWPYKEMMSEAGIDEKNIKILAATTIKQTLKDFGLYPIEAAEKGEMSGELAIDVDTQRIVCLVPFKIADEGPPKPNIGKVECILTHIRNALAHGNTYFFDNDNVLFEDKNGSIITARIVLKVQTLIDWILLIDKKNLYPTLNLKENFDPREQDLNL